MGKRIFLDIGAHTGETLRAAVEYPFDLLIGFEPSPISFEQLEENIKDPRVELINSALSNKTSKGTIYHSGSIGATLFGDKPWRASNVHEHQACEIIQASEFFKTLSRDDTIIVKMNCEGSEVDILDDLMDSGEIEKIDVLMADWDALKIPSIRPRVEQTQSRLNKYDMIKFPAPTWGTSHSKRTKGWLDQAFQELDIKWANSNYPIK